MAIDNHGSTSQKIGVRPNNKSRNVPPPNAVINATLVAPTISMLCLRASSDPDTAEAMTAKLARKIHAYIVIYGVIISDGEKSSFLPEFYINHSSFQDASEITGEHELGSPLRVVLPFSESIQPIQNPALAGRVSALDLVTLGLAYYSADDFDNALTYFQHAAEEDRWVGGGKEVVYLLIGNAFVRKVSKTQNLDDLPLASENYRIALDNNSKYARAMIGEANVLYLKAADNKENCDQAGLDQASDLLDQALSLEDQPASANIETKVHFYRGQIAIIRDACHQAGNDWLVTAHDEFNWVINHYEILQQNNEQFNGIESLASHSYARLGYIAYQSGNFNGAVDWLNKSVEIASPYYQAYYTSLIGDIYQSAGQSEKAIQAYEDAIAIAISNGDGESVKIYQEKLQDIEGG